MKNKFLKSCITLLAWLLVIASSKATTVKFKFCNCHDSCTYVIKLCPQACQLPHGGCISLQCETDSLKPGTCDSMQFNVPAGYVLSMSSIVFQVSNLSNSATWTFGTSTTHGTGNCQSPSSGKTWWTALGGNSFRICDDSTWHSKVLGVAGIIDESEFKVYPNPTTDVSNVYFSLMKDADVNIDVYNMLEQKVFTYKETSSPSGTHSVAISNLKPGIYIVRFMAGGDLVTRKLIVQ
jgi:hypothetical protein